MEGDLHQAVAVAILFALCLFLLMNGQLERISQVIVDQNVAFVGQVLKNDPSLEQEVIHYVTQGADSEEIALGRQVLSRYGYTQQMNIADQPALSGIALPYYAAGMALLFVIPVLMLVFWEYRRFFSRIRKVAFAADQVVEGKFDQSLPEIDEGDFSVLGHSFNAMAGRLSDSVAQLKQEKTFLSNLLADISHQLKTPLASLIVFNEHLLDDPHMDAKLRATFLERSKLQLERMEWLIISLLKLARVEAGAIAYRKRQVRPLEIIYDTMESLSGWSEPKQQSIIVHGGENMILESDEEWLSEAVNNLTKNALEHSPVSGEVHIVLEDTPLFSSIIIRDQGEGIPPKIFRMSSHDSTKEEAMPKRTASASVCLLRNRLSRVWAGQYR